MAFLPTRQICQMIQHIPPKTSYVGMPTYIIEKGGRTYVRKLLAVLLSKKIGMSLGLWKNYELCG